MVKPKRQKTGGRQKGTPNKVTGELRELVLGALSELGGMDYLVRQGRENPNAYLTLLGKCLPKEITGANGVPLIPSAPTINLTLSGNG
jgi:hypothetical protein